MKKKEVYSNLETETLAFYMKDEQCEDVFVIMAKRSKDQREFSKRVKGWINALRDECLSYRDPHAIQVLLDIGSIHRIEWDEIGALFFKFSKM